MLLAQFSAENL